MEGNHAEPDSDHILTSIKNLYSIQTQGSALHLIQPHEKETLPVNALPLISFKPGLGFTPSARTDSHRFRLSSAKLRTRNYFFFYFPEC